MDKSDPRTLEITSNSSFRIFTTLRYTIFNDSDLQNPPPIITAWTAADARLLQLHSQRLQASALAFHWTDVATLLEREGSSLLSKHLDQAFRIACIGNGTITGVKKGYFAALRAHVDVSRTAEFDIQFVPMGAEQPLSALQTDSFHTLPSPAPPNSRSSSPSRKGYCTVTLDTEPTPSTLFTSHKTSHRTFYDASRDRAGISHSSPLDREVLLYNTDSEITEASVSTVYFYRDGRWTTPAADCGGNLSVTRRLALEGGFCVEGKVLLGDVQRGEWVWLSNAARGFFEGLAVR